MVTPYKSDLGKKAQVEYMFDSISERYDFLNHFLSLGIDKIWRRKAISMLKPIKPKYILDIATGTGDLAIAALRLKPEKVTGIDISWGMLKIGIEKIHRKKLDNKIELLKGDSEKINFPDQSFDAITCAFGVRNFENLRLGLSEMHRVLKNDGAVVILEFSKPSVFPVKQVYKFYFKRILPFLGKKVSKDKSAYNYLPESVNAFPEGKEFCSILKESGFSKVTERRLSMGIASIYFAHK